jgi:hypothetical protein
MLKDFIWSYINARYDEDGVIPHSDEIYEKFQVKFDNGADLHLIDETIYNFAQLHDLTDVEIKWEGEIK